MSKREKFPVNWDRYSEAFKNFKTESKKAKRFNKKFCEELEGASRASKLLKTLSKEPSTSGFPMIINRCFRETNQEQMNF